MASSGTAADGVSLKLDSIPTVDLRLLSQSELYSLSLCSSAAFDPRRCDDVVIPKIDRSVFNESAGSRKQTYSRLRLAPPSSFSSSSSATPRRRAPQLRSPAVTFPKIQDNSDPENAENSHIVALLKQLFVADLKSEELVPVKIDYSDSLPSERLSSLPTSSASSVRPEGQKRKRGRPRQDEVLENKEELAPAGGVVDVAGDAGGFPLPNQVVERINMEDRDRDILNRDGVTVDLVALGAVQHPYQEEIRRRTEGLTTYKELWEFLRGLDGEWSNRRMTKRIVDANVFGSALPVGWNLSLSIKKENDQVWLYCRRYISPSGLHFVSCKGVSSYLLSLHGIQDTNIPYSLHHNEIGGGDKLTPVTIPDIAADNDHRKENIVFPTSSPAINSTSGNHEMQAVKTAIDSLKDSIGEPLHCSKCNVTFSKEDELLQHQSSHHRKRSKNVTRISDGVIVKDGKYECQFCHKTFSERHRYNGHVGTHVRNQAKIAGESRAGNVGGPVDPRSVGEFPLEDTVLQGKLDSDNSVEKICISINNGENLCSLDTKNNANIGDMKGLGDATDVVSETTTCIVADVHFSSQCSGSLLEEAKVKDCAAQKINDDSSFQQNRYGNGSPLPVDDATNGLHNVHVIETTHWTQNLDECMVSKRTLVDSNRHGGECGAVVNNECISKSRSDANLDSENLPVSKSIFNFFGTYGESTSISGSMASKLNDVPDVNTLPTSQVEKACSKDDVSCLTDKYEVDETYSLGIWEKDYEKADAVKSKNEEVLFGINSVIPSWNGQEKELKKYDTTMPTCQLNGPGAQNSSENKLVSLYSMQDIEHNDAAVCESNVEVSEFDNFQTFENRESTDSFRSSHIGLNFNSIMGSQHDMKLGVSSASPSATDRQFFLEDNGMRIMNSFTEHKQDQPSGVLQLNRSGYDPANHSKLGRVENTGKHELSLSINDLQTELRTDSFSDEQKRYLTDSFNTQSVHRAYGDRTLLSTNHSNLLDPLKQGKAVHIGIPDSPFNIKTHELVSNFGTAHPRDHIGTSGQNFMAAFGSGGSLSGNCGTANGSWRTGHENVFQGTFIAAMSPQIPSSNCYGTFNLTSNKGEEGSSQVNKSYNFQNEPLRPVARTGPVEHRFLMEGSSNSVPQESRIFPYTSNMEQGLDPSFWFGKDALMPNANLSNQVSSICIWCRNMFFHGANEFSTQTGAIGAMCPTCCSKIPSQFNAP